jgi:hypothetical protein
LQTSGLFRDLAADTVTSPSNETSLVISGAELPSVRLSPDVALALSRQSGMPEVSGAVKYENRNFRGLGQRLLCELSHNANSLFDGTSSPPAYSLFWSDCNIGEGNIGINAFLSADNIALDAHDSTSPNRLYSDRSHSDKSRLVKAGMAFDRRYPMGRAGQGAALSVRSEPYVMQVTPEAGPGYGLAYGSGRHSRYGLVGAKHSLSVKALGAAPFAAQLGVDIGYRSAGPGAGDRRRPEAVYSACTASCKLALPDVTAERQVAAAAAVLDKPLRFARRMFGYQPKPASDNETHIDLNDRPAHITSLLTFMTSWFVNLFLFLFLITYR